MEEFFSARRPSSSAEVRELVIHDIKEVEGVRQQEEQEDKRDEEEGEVEEITHREDDYGMNEDSNLSRLEPDSVRASNKEDSPRTTTLTDNKRETTKTKDLQCMKTHALASTTLTCSPSVSGHFTHCWDFRSVLHVVNSIVVASHCENGSFEVLSLHKATCFDRTNVQFECPGNRKTFLTWLRKHQ